MTKGAQRTHADHGWQGTESEVARAVLDRRDTMLRTYGVDALRVREDYIIEQSVLSGGYGRRQVFELVQNAADAIQLSANGTGRVAILLTDTALYCANEGEPIDPEGVTSLLMSHLSSKRGKQIGHFGLGFKSVLAVTNCPQFYSRSGSFEFSADRSAEQIRAVAPNAVHTPILRIAFPVDPIEAAEADGCLADLMQWATTVVKLPCKPGHAQRFSDDLRAFPSTFLLFSPHVAGLILEDRTSEETRTISSSPAGHLVEIREGNEISSWAVFSRDIQVASLPADARDDADTKVIEDRATLPLLWAVQTGGTRGRSHGSFWAFFPTKTETSLAGILNAPWKTNSNRRNLLEGPYNLWLLDRAADLIGENITRLSDPKDPGKLLDLLPASEDTGPEDRHLKKQLIKQLSRIPCMPATDGSFCIPSQLRLRPDVVRNASAKEWLVNNPIPDVTSGWCHATVEQNDTRRYRAKELGCASASVQEWLQAVSRPATVASSLAAIELAEAILKDVPAHGKSEVLSAAFVLGADSNLYAPSFSRFFIASPETAGDPADVYVHPEIAVSPEANRILTEVLGIMEMSPVAQLQVILETIRKVPSSMKRPQVDWERLWMLTRQIDKALAVKLLADDSIRRALCVRTLDADFHRLGRVLLPGAIVPSDGSRDASVAADMVFHRNEVDILRLLGLVDAPTSLCDESKATWFNDYKQYAEDAFVKQLPAGSPHPHTGLLKFISTTTYGPLDPISDLSDEGKARFVEHLLPFAVAEECWIIRHPNYTTYRRIPISPAPLAWLIREHGRLRSTLGIVRVEDAVGEALLRWDELLPVVKNPASLDLSFLNLPSDLTSLGEQHWQAGFLAAQRSSSNKLIGAFYAEAVALQQPQPERIRCLNGSECVLLPPNEVYVAADDASFSAHTKNGMPCIMVPSRQDAERLVVRWGLRLAINSTLGFTPKDDDYPLLDQFPGLRGYLKPEQHHYRLQPCSELWVETCDPATGVKRQNDDFMPSKDNLCFYVMHTISGDDLLMHVIDAFGLRLSDTHRQQVLQHLDREERLRRLRAIQQLPSLAEKLLFALGESALRARLSASLIDSANVPIPSLRFAEMALATYGIDTLRKYCSDLESADWDPPQQWAGGARAQRFVRELGFPLEYAGFPSSGRRPYEEIEGPVKLKPLHEFQQKISCQVHDFLGLTPPSRGLLSLPTGAGKTRVIVQSLVCSISEGHLGGVLLWIAQTDELCEQAVQTWSEVWRALGPKQTLRISRFWGETNDYIGPAADPTHPHLVVSTYQTLKRRMEQPEYMWLTKPSCVIIDEAHGAVASSYTQILANLGLTSNETARPLIGLTATPFRGGQDESQTLWLVHRFDSTRFDKGIFLLEEPYAELQRMGILAYVDHERLQGVRISLTDKELEELRQFSNFPSSAEQKLGEDANRNRILLASISGLPAEWPVLFFATSVDHAHLMAALLTLQGIPARAISTETDRRTRRYYIEEFKQGRLRVLTNYNVLTTGFDAPSVRALYIARPVYSSGLYQQMIGRGLRGPKNGGKDRCLIVNVEDNVQQYGERLAFRHFEYLWSTP